MSHCISNPQESETQANLSAGQSTLAPTRPALTDEQIIEIRKQASGGRFGRPATTPWGDTLKFARALLAAAPQAEAQKGGV